MMGDYLAIAYFVGLLVLVVVMPVWIAPRLKRRRLAKEKLRLGIVYCTWCDSPATEPTPEGPKRFKCQTCDRTFDDDDYLPPSLYQDPASNAVSA